MSKSTGPAGVFSPGEYYSLQEAAKRMNITTRTLRAKYVIDEDNENEVDDDTPKLKVGKLARGSEMVSYSELARFLEELMP